MRIDWSAQCSAEQSWKKKPIEHETTVCFQERVGSRFDDARLGALVEIGEHNATKDMVLARYLLQHFDDPADYLRLESLTIKLQSLI